jgi:hypothetical protein
VVVNTNYYDAAIFRRILLRNPASQARFVLAAWVTVSF